MGNIAEAFFQAVLQQNTRAESALGRALHRRWNATGSVEKAGTDGAAQIRMVPGSPFYEGLQP
jgi:hypothetical protein